jgi:hypothetical protein
VTPGTHPLFSPQPTWSPESDQLPSVPGSNDVHLTDIWSINVDGSHWYQATHQPAEHSCGQRLARLP